MFQSDAPVKNPVFSFYPSLCGPLRAVVSIPHSGEDVPEVFKPHLTDDTRAMQEDVDTKVNELVDIPALQAAGIGVLVAHIHRVCVDINRDEDNCILCWKENTKGLRLVVKDPSRDEARSFLERYHRPYFEVLGSLILELERTLSGKVPVVDLHSMPSAPTAYHRKQNPNQKTHRANFCLSDQRGKTAEPEFINAFVEDLRGREYEVAVNDPYVGGYVTTFVDRYRTNNIQIEINRRLYMDEFSRELVPAKVQALKPQLTACLIKNLTKN